MVSKDKVKNYLEITKPSRKVLFLNPDRGHTCSFYRSGGIAKNLRNQLGADYSIDVVAWTDISTDWQTISNYDIIMLQRPYHRSAVDFCIHVKQMRIPLWLDYDDNLFCVAPENRAWPIFDDPIIQSQIRKMLEIADIITVTTEDLRKSYLQFNKNIVVIPNAFNDTIFDVNRKLDKRDNIVLWRGSDTHIYDIMCYAPAISKCTEEFPEYEFNYVGYNPWFLGNSDGKPAKNQCFIRAMDVVDYFDRCFSLKPAVVHTPLHDNLFNRCKSNIAFIEGTYWGAICIIPEFWGDIPGTLKYKDQASYYEALRSVLAGEVDIVANNELAWQYVKQNLLLSNINKLRVKVIKSLLKKK